MSTVAEIEAALHSLTPQELEQVEQLLHRLRSSPDVSSNTRLQAFEELKRNLALTEEKTDA